MEDGKEEDVKAEEAGPPKVKRWANLHPKIRSHTLQQLGIFAGNGIKGASNRGEEKGGRGGGGFIRRCSCVVRNGHGTIVGHTQ